MNRYLKHIGEGLLQTVKSLCQDVQTILTEDEKEAEENKKIYTKNTGLGTKRKSRNAFPLSLYIYFDYTFIIYRHSRL